MSDEREEKRAGELMRAGAALVDEGLASQLRAFFTEGGPSYTPPPVWTPPPGWEVPEESAAQIQAREAALAAVKPALLDRLAARRTSHAREPVPPESVLDPSLPRFDLGAWRLQFVGDPRELQLSPQAQDRLTEVAPQAVLRDLHRPVLEFPLVLQPLALFAEVAEPIDLDAVMGADYRIRIHELTPTRQMLAEDAAGRREVHQMDWAECRPQVPAARPSYMRDANDLKWFGR